LTLYLPKTVKIRTSSRTSALGQTLSNSFGLTLRLVKVVFEKGEQLAFRPHFQGKTRPQPSTNYNELLPLRSNGTSSRIPRTQRQAAELVGNRESAAGAPRGRRGAEPESNDRIPCSRNHAGPRLPRSSVSCLDDKRRCDRAKPDGPCMRCAVRGIECCPPDGQVSRRKRAKLRAALRAKGQPSGPRTSSSGALLARRQAKPGYSSSAEAREPLQAQQQPALTPSPSADPIEHHLASREPSDADTLEAAAILISPRGASPLPRAGSDVVRDSSGVMTLPSLPVETYSNGPRSDFRQYSLPSFQSLPMPPSMMHMGYPHLDPAERPMLPLPPYGNFRGPFPYPQPFFPGPPMIGVTAGWHGPPMAYGMVPQPASNPMGTFGA